MPTVVSDTSPLNYLCLIEAVWVLPVVFREILVPPAVLAELRHPKAPPRVAAWLRDLPPWVKIQGPSVLRTDLDLDPGETEAISLAMELGIPAILIDERTGRRIAEDRGLIAVGTLNILHTASLRGLLDFESAIARLRATNFHVNDATVTALLESFRLQNDAPAAPKSEW